MKIWINNTDGKPDAMLTFSAVAFISVIVKFLLNGVSFEGMEFGTIDSEQIAALLGPTLLAYVGRRYTDAAHAPYSDYVVENGESEDLEGRSREG